MSQSDVLACFLAGLRRNWPPQALAGKLGAPAIALMQDYRFLQNHPAPVFEAMAKHFIAQQTTSACSLASVTLALNVLKEPAAPCSQNDVLAQSGSPDWQRQTAKGGDGVHFSELVDRLTVLARFHGLDLSIYPCQPARHRELGPADFCRMLEEIQPSKHDIVVIYFNQGVLTGDWNGPHVSPIGAYDGESGRVLIMDVDRELNIPYWAPAEAVYAAMVKPVDADHGVLAGEVGGWVHLRLNSQ